MNDNNYRDDYRPEGPSDEFQGERDDHLYVGPNSEYGDFRVGSEEEVYYNGNYYREEPNKMRERYGKFEEYLYAGFWIRAAALLFDLLVVSALRGIFLSPLKVYISTDSFAYTGLSTLILLLYFVLMTKFNHGQTLGKMLFGLRVVSLKTEELEWKDVLTREFFSRYILQSVMILYVIAAFSPKKQHLGDMFSDTTVIKTETEDLMEEFQSETA